MANGNGRNKAMQELNPDVLLLRKRLEAVSVGETVGYEELSALVAADVRTRRYSALYRARMRLFREKQMVFSPVRSVGIKRLGDREIAMLGNSFAKRIHKVARRGMRTLACVHEFGGLDLEAQVAHNTGMSVLGTFNIMTMPSKLEMVEKEVRRRQGVLASANMLELFK